MLRWILVILLLVALAPVQAVILRQGDTLRIRAGETLNDDVVVSGGTVVVDGAITNDLVVAGGTVDVNGRVGGDVVAAGGTMNINGPIGGSVYSMGGTMNVNGSVGRNLVLAGGTVNMNNGAVVPRDMAVTGGNVTVGGNIGRNLRASGGNIAILSTALIGGDLIANGSIVTIDDGAAIAGERRITEEGRQKAPAGAAIGALLGFLILTGIGLLLLGLLFLALAPKLAAGAVTMLRTHPWGSLLTGFLTAAAFPLAFMLVLFSIIGIPLATVALCLYIIGITLGPIILAMLVGQLVLRDKQTSPFVALVVGIGLLILLLLITWLLPPLGMFITWLIGIAGFGALLLALQARTARPIFAEQPPPADTGAIDNKPHAA